MKREVELEVALRDSILVYLSIEYEYYSKALKQEKSAILRFIRFDRELIELKLYGISESDIYDDFSGLCISHVKVLKQNDDLYISLDPYNERVDVIESKDNFVFKVKSYKLDIRQV